MLVGVVAALVAAPLLARLARRVRWVDRAEGAAARKLQARPVPAIGGLVVLLALGCVWGVLALGGGHWDAAIAPWIDPRAGAASLVLAFAAGAIDDRVRGGLGARAKLGLQGAAGVPAAASVFFHRLAETGAPDGALLAAAGLLLGALVAQNAFNTFDNADGATTALGVLALAIHAPVFAGPLLGFLPWNLNARAREGARGTPTAYLGDAGSHLLGMLILLVPAAWPAFALPLLDLARLAVRRVAVGSRPWIGDRRHLAHRLAHAGLGRGMVCLALLAVALPAVANPGALGLALTGGAFLAAVVWTGEPDLGG
jgi:UDP-N-acetylmuramyl pentapeptide phosphotransferase/UDP-N-acetylglucosamine-1-phosphate transferase